MVCVDHVFDNVSGVEEPGAELVEVELVRLLKPLELKVALGGKNGRRAAAEAAVVDASDGRVMVGEFREDIYLRHGIGGWRKRRGMQFG